MTNTEDILKDMVIDLSHMINVLTDLAQECMDLVGDEDFHDSSRLKVLDSQGAVLAAHIKRSLSLLKQYMPAGEFIKLERQLWFFMPENLRWI